MSPKFIPGFSQIRVAQSLVVLCSVLFIIVFLSSSICHFIGLLYFIDDFDNTLERNRQYIEHIRSDLWDKLNRLGPQKTADCIKQHLDRWETEEVRFAIAGKSATGKSTFINTFRGIKEDQDGFADVGFGHETEKISEYKHPVNENIIFCDLPGLSLQFTKLKFLEMVNLSEYSYIFIFFESVLTEDDEWLAIQIQEKGIPFCLVRSKVDKDVESHKGIQIGEKGTLLKIRQKIKDSMSTNKPFARAELFLISSEKPHIGEMSNLQDHMKEKLPSNQFSAVMFSLPILTEMVIEKKLLELEHRMPYVSIGAAIITAFPIPLIDIPINIALINGEVGHYIKVLGLDRTHSENIEGLKNDFSVVSVHDFVLRKIKANCDILSLVERSARGIVHPIAGSVSAGRETMIFVNQLLSDVLSELKKDATTVYIHFLSKDRR